MNKYDIAIIGGGAAGMMAAIAAGNNKNIKIVLIERNPGLGKKILATGNGRCNLTNTNADSRFYHGGKVEFIDSVISCLNPKTTMSLFEEMGLILKEEDKGRIFPRNDQASSVVETLTHKLKDLNIEAKTEALVRKIAFLKKWLITLENKELIIADKIILTVGGKAAFQFGSSGDGYYWAKQFGHSVIETYPALVPIETKETWVKEAQGIRIVGKISVLIDDNVIAKKQGDILFTHFGLSGPGAMSVARAITPNLNQNILICIDLIPEINASILENKIRRIFETQGAKSTANSLSGFIPSKLAEIILINLKIDPAKKSAEISKKDRIRIVNTLKKLTLTPKGVRTWKEAQVTSGGINTDEINPKTMESIKMPGLYFAGEIVDVDGESGGFNLQWAWSSGYVAGTSASNN